MEESRILNYIPAPRQETETFYIKGLHLPRSAYESCLAQLVGSYYAKDENIIVFTSSFGGKLEAINEVTQKLENYVVFSDMEHCSDKFRPFSKELLAGKRHLIFYNMPIPFQEIKSIDKYHISAFYAYSLDSCENYPKRYQQEYIEEFTRHFPAGFIHTIICKEPKKKVVDFRFGTDEEIKHICLNDVSTDSLAYCKKDVAFNFPNIRFISEAPKRIRTNKFIFYDLDVERTLDVLKAVDDVVFVYTKNDFPTLKKIIKIVEDFGLETPEHIKRIAGCGA